jgi:hypothetical protein
MAVYVSKDNQQSGPYEDQVVIDQLKNGTLAPVDLGIRQGEASWRSLGEMFPGVTAERPSPAAVSAIPVSSGIASNVNAAVPAPKKGGCLKTGLLVAGILMLVIGIAVGVGGRFIPSVSCDLVESDAHEIEKVRSDLDKARRDDDTDEIRVLEFRLKQALSGAEVSQANCDRDKLTKNIVGVAGGGIAVVGFLFALIGFFIGRRK